MTNLAINVDSEMHGRLAAVTDADARTDSFAADVIRYYRIGPVCVGVNCVLPEVAEAFHKLYHRYELVEPVAEHFLIEVRAQRSPRTLRRYYHVYGDGEELFVVRKKRSVLPHLEWALNIQILRFLPRYYQIHASVMSRDGVGVIFPGSPGQGKSTLAAALLLRGWSYLSDEFALIDPETLLLHPYPKALCVKWGSFELLKQQGLPLDQCPSHVKGLKGPVRFVSPLAVRSDAVSAPCPIRFVIQPQQTPGATPALEPISRARAMYNLIEVSFNFTKFRQRGFDLLAKVMKNAQCYRLRSSDLEATCQLVNQCVDQVVQERRRYA